MTTEETDRLMSVAIATARVLGFGIAPNCQQLLEAALLAATPTAVAAKGEPPIPTLTLESTLRLADVRVAQYIAAMAGDAIRTGPPPDGLLHENNFLDIQSWLCPCWPIC
jgi:hypothetical protein